MNALRWMTVACLSVLLIGCGKKKEEPTPVASPVAAPETKPAKKVVMGVSFDSLQIERWQKDRDILVAEAKKLGAECLFQDANGDARKQNEQCEILLGQGIDVLVIIPKSATASARAVRSAKQQGVPVLSYDRLILECDVDAYISYDNTAVGALQAQSLVDRVKGKYFLLGGAPDDNNAKLLREGQMQVLDPLIKAGEIEIVGDQWATGWSPSKAREIIENLLVNVGTDLNAIVASNDGTAGGAIQALRAQGLDGKVLISGQDADLQACKRILAGTQTVTVYKPLRPLAERAAAVAVQLARGETIGADQEVNNGHIDVPAVLLEPVAVDKDNVMDVIVGDGHHSREALLN